MEIKMQYLTKIFSRAHWALKAKKGSMVSRTAFFAIIQSASC